MRIVAALGGNALIPRGQSMDLATQHRTASAAATALAPVLERHQVVITHGNGPQVGLLALQADAYRDVEAYPLDVLVAESEGMIGYILETELDRVTDAPVVTMLTRTEVRPDDPAFEDPTKPIGPVYDRVGTLRRLAAQGWVMRSEGRGYRRVVASPEPIRFPRLEVIRMLVEAGVVVICAGGGGIPVRAAEDGTVRGVEAVIDKDLSSSLLAVQLEADLFVSLTDVDGVYERWGQEDAELVAARPVSWFRERRYASGSMGPKVEAACRFVEATGRRAAIGRLGEAAEVVAGRAGTTVEPVPVPVR